LHCGNSASTQELDRYEAQHVEFWDAMATLAEHELAEARRQEEIDRARVRGDAPPPHLQRREAGWHTSINDDVSSMLAGAHGWPCQEQCHLFLALPCERPAIMPPLMPTVKRQAIYLGRRNRVSYKQLSMLRRRKRCR